MVTVAAPNNAGVYVAHSRWTGVAGEIRTRKSPPSEGGMLSNYTTATRLTSLPDLRHDPSPVRNARASESTGTLGVLLGVDVRDHASSAAVRRCGLH